MNIESELNKLFNFYSNRFADDELKEIIRRGFVYSKVNYDSEILICGFNPSLRNNYITESYAYKFNKVEQDLYFKKFHRLFKNYKSSFKVDYLDLFYQRHSKQAEIHKFLKDDIGLKFLCEQLIITQEILETIRPKIIFLFNKQGANFFGKNKSSKSGKNGSNVWLGYTFEHTDIEDLYKIKGFSNSEERINPSLKITNLEGSYIYFSRFLNHYVNSLKIIQIQKDINTIINLMKKNKL